MPSARLNRNRDGSEMGGNLWVSTFLGGGGKTSFSSASVSCFYNRAGPRTTEKGSQEQNAAQLTQTDASLDFRAVAPATVLCLLVLFPPPPRAGLPATRMYVWLPVCWVWLLRGVQVACSFRCQILTLKGSPLRRLIYFLA